MNRDAIFRWIGMFIVAMTAASLLLTLFIAYLPLGIAAVLALLIFYIWYK
jgi:hypothetical protein